MNVAATLLECAESWSQDSLGRDRNPGERRPRSHGRAPQVREPHRPSLPDLATLNATDCPQWTMARTRRPGDGHRRVHRLVNTRRIQRELGYRSPDEYETAWHAQTEPDNLAPAPTGGR
jgi:hypothetical protein